MLSSSFSLWNLFGVFVPGTTTCLWVLDDSLWEWVVSFYHVGPQVISLVASTSILWAILLAPRYCNSHVRFAQLLWWLSLAWVERVQIQKHEMTFLWLHICWIAELEFKSGWLYLQSPCDIFASLKFHKTIQCLTGWRHLEDEPQVSHLDNHE